MSQSIIEKLLKGAEVEWKPLGEVCKFKNGFAFKSSLFKEVGDPIVRITNIDGKIVNTDYVKYFQMKDYSEDLTSYTVNKGDIIIAMSGATTGKLGLYNHEYTSYLNQRVGKFIPKQKILNNKYLYHYLQLKVNDIFAIAGGGAQPNLSSNKLMEKFKIPVPPLSVQKEIVRILDAFTSHAAELTAELTAELNQRKKQYNYYLNKLLTFSADEVELKALGKILKRTGGTSITAEKMKELNKANGALKIFAGGRTFAFADFNDIPEKDINKYPSIIVKSRGNIEFDYYDKPFSHKKEFWSYHSENDNIDIKYIYYYVKNKEQYFQHIGNKMQMPQISIRDTDIFLVPVPPLSVQKEIVRKLDAFSTLTTSISDGLPKEIELRNKQYEYYRNQLLNFPKQGNDAIKQSPTNL